MSFDVLWWKNKLEALEDIPIFFIVNGVQFYVAESWLSKGVYTKHRIVNTFNGNESIVSHSKILQYL